MEPMRRLTWAILCLGLFATLQLAKSAGTDPGADPATLATAVESGDQDARVRLARLHLLGNGVPKDERKALDLVRPAAEAGHGEAQALYG